MKTQQTFVATTDDTTLELVNTIRDQLSALMPQPQRNEWLDMFDAAMEDNQFRPGILLRLIAELADAAADLLNPTVPRYRIDVAVRSILDHKSGIHRNMRVSAQLLADHYNALLIAEQRATAQGKSHEALAYRLLGMWQFDAMCEVSLRANNVQHADAVIGMVESFLSPLCWPDQSDRGEELRAQRCGTALLRAIEGCKPVGVLR